MKKLLVILSAATFLAACKKDDDSQSRTDLLTSGKWTVTQNMTVASGTINGITIIDTTDNYADTKACERDNTVMFEKLGTITIDEGPTKCKESDPQTKSGGNWALVNNDQKLRWNPDNFTADFTINELTSNRMRLSLDSTLQAGTSGSSTNIKLFVTFVR